MQQTVNLRTFGRYVSLNILGMIGISCYILADTFFVSQGLGATGLAALNIAIPAFNLLNGLGLMIGVGAATQFSICHAQHNVRGADRAFTHAVLLGLSVSAIFLLFGLFGAAPLSRLLGADAQTFPLTVTYLRTILSFSPFFVMNNVLLAFVRNDGAPDLAMCGMVVGSLSNIVFDYLFIFPLGMGMFGAALATGVSPIISILIQLRHVRKPSRGFHLHRMRPQWRFLPTLCAPGLASLISEASSGVVLLLFNRTLLHLAGNTGVAAYGIVANLALVAIAVFQGLSTGMQPLVSHSRGQDDDGALRRLFRYGTATALGIATLVYLLVAAGAVPIAAAFNNAGDPVLAAYAVTGLRIYFLGFWFAGLNIVSATFFSASGRTGAGFAISLLRGVAAIPPILLLLAALGGITGVWAAFPAVEALTALLTLFCIRRAFSGR